QAAAKQLRKPATRRYLFQSPAEAPVMASFTVLPCLSWKHRVQRRSKQMIYRRIAKWAIVGFTALAFAGCASHYDRRTNNAMMGAGLGAAAGAVVSQGDPVYAVGGAAAGGLRGPMLTAGDRRSRGWDRGGRGQQAKQRGDRDYRGTPRKHPQPRGPPPPRL